jgi:murein DD-endopeptidase MepM/ murein hydrolase activator NlpD
MSIDSDHRRKEKKKYTILLVPSSKTESQKSFIVGKLSLFFIAVSIIGLMLVFVFVILVYTPISNYLPRANPELENRYGKQIVIIQQKLNGLMEEIVVLKKYNQQLRRALGENVSNSDTTSITKADISSYEKKTEETNKPVELDIPDRKSPSNEDKFDYTNGLSSSSGYPNQRLYDNEFGIAELPFSKPVDGFSSRVYDPRSGHFGIDIAGKEGSAVLAAAPGTVIFSDWLYDYGFTLIIAHENGFLTVYKHNRLLIKSVGDNVRRGEPIAFLGNTGKRSTGPHLHFEIWRNGYSIDPNEYLLISKKME